MALAAAVSVATVLVRLVFPIASGHIGQSKLFQWPQFVATFGLGVLAAQRGWLDPVPDRIRRKCGFAALGDVGAFLLLAATMAATGVDPDVLTDLRVHWAPLALAAIEGPLAIGTSIWLLAVAQRHLNRRLGPLGRAMSRSAYAAFVLQGIVLIGLMIGPPLGPQASASKVKSSIRPPRPRNRSAGQDRCSATKPAVSGGRSDPSLVAPLDDEEQPVRHGSAPAADRRRAWNSRASGVSRRSA